jgi:hypothetical protein
MPMLEHQSIKVTLTVEVDGHTLTFTETGKAIGARYHGADPRVAGYSSGDSLESKIRTTVEECVTEVGDKAEMFLSRAYLTHEGVAPGESTDAPHRP